MTLFSALMIGATGTFTSCKDYDDDIKNLQEQLGKKASLEELAAKVSTLETAVNDAKTAANEAKDKAQEALDKAGSAEGGVSDDDLKALKKELQDQIDKLASLDIVNQKIAALKEELKGDFVTDEKLKDLAAEIDKVSAEVMSLIGHRLTSLAVIPTSHINGIAAITLTTLQYTPQKYQAMAKHTTQDHTTTPVLDHVNAAATANFISTDYNEAYFHVSPSVGVRTSDIELPSFDCITSENIMTKATGADIKTNSPIQPVKYDINKDVLTVKFKKTVKGSIAATTAGDKEKFYMASLKAPIAAENYTAAEKKAFDEQGTKVYVNSEYVRLHEEVKVPYLVNSKTDFSKTMTGKFADEIQNDGKEDFYVHYHDSVCVYESKANEYVDFKQPYNEPLDLKKLVKVCVTDAKDAKTNHANHANLANYKDYGLTFRFYIPTAPYNTLGGVDGNTNKTDQQKFAKLDSHENGIMSSKVYTVEGTSATAVGREPIVRVELVDTVNNALVAMRYLKVKWVKEAGERELSHAFADSIYYCSNYTGRIGTQEMNEDIYDKAKEGGMTKNEFHAIYTEFIVGEGAGTAEDLKDPEEGVESHNILWTLNEEDLGVFWPGQQEKTFTKTVIYKDPKGINADITVVMTRTVYMPALNVWGHMGTYWKGEKEYKIFNINPIVYGTKESNPAWNVVDGTNPTCNIYTDLLNGFLDDRGVKPTEGAAGAIYYTDKNVANTKFYYPAFGPMQPDHTMPENANGIYYAEEGVRFVFDKARIANYTYIWNDGTEVKAELRNNDTELWIKGELAATIVNHKANLLNADELTYNIKLQEAVPDHAVTDFTNQPTEAAKALVGKMVPINLVADLCNNAKNVGIVKQYEANIIEPLQVKKGEIDNIVDAKNEGSSIDVTGAFTYYSWNDNKQIVENTTGLPKALYDFYQVREAVWPLKAGSDNILDVTKIKTNLKLTDGNLEPEEGYTNGKLPANIEIRYEEKDIDGDGDKEKVLTYYNYSGTPVNKAYKLFIPVEYGYKWKTLINVYEITVAPNSGTPGTR